MKKWLIKLFAPRPKQAAHTSPANSEEILALQKEIQSLQMELEARKQSISALKQEVERLRERQEAAVEEAASVRLEPLFTDLASPVSQILTQADLLEQQGKPVQAADILAVARRIVRAVERHGIAFEGKIGGQAAYDPNLHTLMNKDSVPKPGQTVTIRFVGISYKNKMIYKAIVEQ
jgi:molecular chaperone GrpE (heat shock protein)